MNISKYKKFWYQWEIRLFVTCSLLLQIILIFFAPFRQRKPKKAKLIKILIWLAYLLADTVATFSLGQLSSSIGNPYSKKNAASSSNFMDKTYIDKHNDLLAFWAPFLFLHLGGPDTITAFALEDNELWLRHFLYLGVHLSASGYVFVQSFPNNSLVIPTLLLFVAGIIRYLERTLALYLASVDGFKSSLPKVQDPGTNYAMLIDEYTLNSEAGLSTSIAVPDEYQFAERMSAEDGTNGEKVFVAYEFFKTFKRIIIDLLLGFNERNRSRDFLLKHSTTAEDAFTIVDIQLGLTYDILYTKASVVHNKRGYATRAICCFSILVAFFVFLHFQAREISQGDIVITYTLLGGAMILEVVALINLIFSPWTFVSLNHPFLRSFGEYAIKDRLQIYISQYNLIKACWWDRKHFNSMRKISKLSWLAKKIRDQFMVSFDEVVSVDLMVFIFDELKRKSTAAVDFEKTKQLSSCRGSWALEQRACHRIFGWTVQVEFEESILLWHIATDICLHPSDVADKTAPTQDEDKVPLFVAKRRRVSELISQYILYLLVLHPSMISSMEGLRQVKYQDAYEEAMSFIKTRNTGTETDCREQLRNLSSDMPDKSKLVLFDACYLVKQLNKFSERRKWEIISEVWAELLSYAASHCRGKHHSGGLIRGGEFLTYVWFLMAQLGLGEQYHVVSSHASAKLVVQP